MKYIVKCGIIICCVVSIIFIIIKTTTFFSNHKHKNHGGILEIIEFIKSTQEPLRKIETKEYIYKYYEDICLVFRSSGTYVRAEITGDKYKLNDDIKVGSEKHVVEQTFAKKKKIRDLPDNQFGFIEDNVWYHFYYDETNKVEKILVYSVGP